MANENSRISNSSTIKQLTLPLDNIKLSTEHSFNSSNFGTFQDSSRSPIHRWFKYPAGYSYKLVETFIKKHKLGKDSWLLDPFVGCGTSSVVAKQCCVNSIGIEAHPFVFWVAKVKCFWEFDLRRLKRTIHKFITSLNKIPTNLKEDDLNDFPSLIHKCYSKENLLILKFIRDSIEEFDCLPKERDLFNLALTSTLRLSSSAGTGWPYIAPSKYHEKNEQPALEVFSKTIQKMYHDLIDVTERIKIEKIKTKLLLMDTRSVYPLESESIDLVITSPPYLNNYDYADRTRLEMYFFGWAKSWKDITEKVRDKLIIAATTQVRRTEFDDDPLSKEIKEIEPSLYNELYKKVIKLRERRLTKGGRKSYDLMVAGYFNDMLLMLKQVYRVLKPKSEFILVLGDSAPYGVYIATDKYLGRLALAAGFNNYSIQNLRQRGGKWAHNPQRHKVKLKEGLLFLYK